MSRVRRRSTLLSLLLSAALLTPLLGLPAGAGPLEPAGRQLDQQLGVWWNEIGVRFNEPLWVTSPPDDPDTLFVAERAGAIHVVRNGDVAPRLFLDPSATPFLHVGNVSVAGEQGFGTMVFHPDFADNGRFYVHYPDENGDNVLAEYQADPDTYTVVPDSRREILFVEQPRGHHNGLQLAFGPDGYLYVGIGDGGGGPGDGFTFAPDPENNAQRLDTLLGKVLRIDPVCCDDDGELFDDDFEYSVPTDNPFIGETEPSNGDEAHEEIWALGLRQPWRFSFDRETGDLWLADVGSLGREEVTFLPADEDGRNAGKSANLGWACREGDVAQGSPADRDCSKAGDFVEPTLAYGRDRGCGITGGYVSRGSGLWWLEGAYLYTDLCSPQMRAIRVDEEGDLVSDEPVQRSPLGPSVLNYHVSFGEDADGRLYLVNIAEGNVFRLDPVIGSIDETVFG